jgi:predicted PurR-regulated permease PerM
MRSIVGDEARARVDERLVVEARRLELEPSVLAADPSSAELEPETRGRLARLLAVEEDVLLDSILAQQKTRIREYAPQAINLLYHATVTVLLALLFSFLVLVDVDRLGEQVRALRSSRLQDFYEEAAQPVVRFGYVVGRAIQAQAMIAVLNTALTALGLVLLEIPSLTVLSLIVFVCGFIPVLGTFISTTPIALVALNVGGLEKAAAVVVLVILVHLVEAYLLNPLIVGRHLKINPVLVLVILFVGYHGFGVWGMVLGLPVTLYVLQDVLGVPLSPSRAHAAARAPPSA